MTKPEIQSPMRPVLSRLAAPVLVALLLLQQGCAAVSRPASPAVHDLGVSTVGGGGRAAAMLRGLEVQAAPWLGTTAMGYRLATVQPTRRQAYAESRWAASPAQLVEVSLRRGLTPGQGACRLRVELDEFVQIFDTPDGSRGLVEVRVSLLPGRGEQVLAFHAFSVTRPAPVADAAGGVQALRAATRDLATDIEVWLASLESGPVGRGQAAGCTN